MTWFGNILAWLRRWRAILASVSILLLILLLFPFKMTSAPRWRLRVVDDAGTPVRDIRVTEHWQHYLVESEGHEEVRRTDESGSVDFPDRTVRASMAFRALAKVRRLGSSGAPARSEPYASIVVWGNRDYETVVAVYEPEALLKNEIVVHRHR